MSLRIKSRTKWIWPNQRSQPERRDHVAELGERGVSEDFLDVALGDGAERGVERGGGADPHDDGERLGHHEHVDAAKHVDAGGDHRGGVDERGDGRRAFHRVGQPDVERHLRGLAHGAAKQQERNPLAARHRAAVGEFLQLGEVDAAETVVAPDDAEQKTEVADAVDDEGFFRGVGRGLLFVIMVDEQPGAETDELPENENHEQIVGEHDAEHRKHEDRQAAEEACARLVVVHVAEREDVDEEADEAHHEEHERGEIVELEAEREREFAEAQPLHRRGEAFAAEDELEREDRDGAGGGGGNPRRERALLAEEQRDHRRRGERQQEDQGGGGGGRH